MRWIGQITYDEVAYFREDVIIEAGNKLGIGTTSPASALHVAGTVQVGVDDTGHDVKFFGATSGRYLQWDESDDSLRTTDLASFKVGTHGDLKLHHDGSNSYIMQQGSKTGSFYIDQRTDDADLILRCDDGSGGITAYLTLDGSTKHSYFSAGNVGIGTTSPASLLHVAGTVQVGVDDTGHDVKFFGATSGASFLYDESEDGVVIVAPTDEVALGIYTISSGQPTVPQFQVGRDTGQYWGAFVRDRTAQLVHRQDETDGNPMNTSFELWGGGSGNDNWVWRHGTNSGSSLATVMTLDKAGQLTVTGEIEGGSLDINGVADISGNTQLSGTLTVGVDDTGHDVKFFGATSGRSMLWDESYNGLILSDNTKLQLGSSTGSGDLQLLHDGTNSYIQNQVGQLYINQNVNDGDIVLQSDNGSGGLTAYLTLDGSASRTTFQKQVRFEDSVQLTIGNGGDLELSHDGSVSTINNYVGTLSINQQADDGDIKFRSDDGSGGVTPYLTLDGGIGYTTAQKHILFEDSVKARFGSGSDLQIYHTGSHSYIEATGTGDLYIQQTTDDKDIIFQSDNGAGGVATYFSLDGSLATHDGSATTALSTVWPDNSKVVVGAGTDGRFWHNGSSTFIQNLTGDLEIQNYSDDKDIIFKNDDGAGGTTVYFSLDGSEATHDGSATTNLYTIWPDNSRIALGTGKDIRILHNGTSGFFQNITGDLEFRNFADDKDIIFQSDDGSGGITPYLTIDGSGSQIHMAKPIRFPDSVSATWGAGGDLEIFHNGTYSNIANKTGHLYIDNNTDDGDIVFRSDDGSGGLATYFFLDGSLGRISTKVYNRFDDSARLELGTSGDLGLYHDGSHSYISNATGNLTITNNTDDGDIIFQSDDGSGGVAEYFRLNGGIATPYTVFPDNSRLAFGAGFDLRFNHDGSSSYIENYTGNLLIRNNQDDGDIIFQSDDGSGGVTAYLTLDGSAGYTTVQKNMRFANSVEVELGTNGNLTLEHNGTNGFVTEATGDLTIKNTANDKDIIFQSDDGSGGNATYLTLDGSAGTVEVAKPMNLATPLATDQQKHLACFEFKGYGTSDGTNYEMMEMMTDTNAPFEHDTSTGSNGLTAQTIQTIIRGGGTVMPYAGVLKKFIGWVTSAGSGTVDVGIFKVTPADDTAGNLTPVQLVSERVTASGNATPNSFSETESFDAEFLAGDIIYSAVKGGTDNKQWYFTSTLEVEWN